MITFVLLLASLSGGIATVPGYTTLEACMRAGQAATHGITVVLPNGARPGVTFACIPGPEADGDGPDDAPTPERGA